MVRYHQPGVGGRYASRIIDLATCDSGAWLAWHGYDPVSGEDQIFTQWQDDGQAEPPIVLTPEAGDHGRPQIVAVDHHTADAVWISQQNTLMHASRRDGRWMEPNVATASDLWMHDATMTSNANRLEVGVVLSRQGHHQLNILTLMPNGQWAKAASRVFTDYITRPQLCLLADGSTLVVVEVYDTSARQSTLESFVVRHDICAEGNRKNGHHVTDDNNNDDNDNDNDNDESGQWNQHTTLAEVGESLVLPRLTLDSDGTPWLCYVREQVVTRDGVVSRSAWIDAGPMSGLNSSSNSSSSSSSSSKSQWQITRSLAPLHMGLLPIKRYFGYSGLRRHPQLLTTTDGSVHLLWEQQRDEIEDWNNLWNGYLLGRTYRAGSWEPTMTWQDGGCCFAVDANRLLPTSQMDIAVKLEHQEQGDDFRVVRIDMNSRSNAHPESIKPGEHWSSYSPHVSPHDFPHKFPHSSRPTITVDGQTLSLYFGDFHNHSLCSPDAEGHPDELYHFARDVAGLDFVGITDNDFYPDKALMRSEVNYQQSLVGVLEDPNQFIPFAGFEWTFHRNDGKDSYNHRSIIARNSAIQPIRRIDANGADEATFAKHLAEADVFAHAHHGEFTLLGTSQEANVEITSGWAINMEVSSIVHEHLASGHRFGFIGGSDGHRAVPGLGGALVAVWARSLTREAIVDALANRQCYATTGNRTAIDFRINNTFMGDALPWDGEKPLEITIDIQSHAPLRNIQIIRDGRVVHQFDTNDCVFQSTWIDPDPPQTSAWYYLRVEDTTPYQEHPHNVCQAVGHLSWSSPIWIAPLH